MAGSAVNCAPEAVARGTRVSFTFRRIRPEDNPCDCAFSSLCDSQLSQNPPQELALGDQEARKLEEMHVHEVCFRKDGTKLKENQIMMYCISM